MERILNTAPSAFNSQSSRIVLLFGEEHKALWEIVLEALRPHVEGDAAVRTAEKIASFAAGHGTILFYEDMNIVKQLQMQYNGYIELIPTWSQHASAMHQILAWTALEDVGLGASLQHYNPLIDNAVAERWALSKSWQLIAQMPFGEPLAEPAPKETQPIDGRLRVFGK